jgi:hypothetical protein
MNVLAGLINRAFEAIGSPLRAVLEEEDLVVRDLVVMTEPDGKLIVLDASSPDTVVFETAEADLPTVAGIVVMHIVRRIVARAIEN